MNKNSKRFFFSRNMNQRLILTTLWITWKDAGQKAPFPLQIQELTLFTLPRERFRFYDGSLLKCT